MVDLKDNRLAFIEEYLEEISHSRESKENIINKLIAKYGIDRVNFEEGLKENCIREYVEEKKKEIERYKYRSINLNLCTNEGIRKKGINEKVKVEISERYNIDINVFEQWRDEIIIKMYEKGTVQSEIAEFLGLNQSTISRVIKVNVPEVEQRMISRSKLIPIKVQKDIYEEVLDNTLFSFEDEWGIKRFRELIKSHLIKSGKDIEQVNEIIKNRRMIKSMYNQYPDYFKHKRYKELEGKLEEDENVENSLNELQKDNSLVLVDYIKLPEDKDKQERFLVIARANNRHYHEVITKQKFVKVGYKKVEVKYKVENVIRDFFKRILKKEEKPSVFIISESSKEQLYFSCKDFKIYLISDNDYSTLYQEEYEKGNNSLIDDVRSIVEENKEEFDINALDDVFKKYENV